MLHPAFRRRKGEVMMSLLDYLTKPIPPADGTEFTLYEMKPTTYRVEHEKDDKGNVTVKYLVVDPEADQEKPETSS